MNVKFIKSNFSERLIGRRRFLNFSGAILGAAALMQTAACSNSHTPAPANLYDAGTGDTGILNFLYANEELQAAFYIAVFTSPYPNMTGDELKYMNDIHDHDIIHRDFFQEFLGNKGFPNLTADFSPINFSDRTAVLSTAKMLKHTSIAAYSSVAYMLKNADYLTAIGKIASVEGRHASTIGSLINYGSLLDNAAVDSSTSLEIAQSPADVLTVINSYLKTKITATNLV